MIIGEDGKSVHINYPCEWKYTLIGSDPAEMEIAIREVVSDYNYSLSMGNASKRGKYWSMHLHVEVPTEEIRLEIFAALEKNKSIKLVL